MESDVIKGLPSINSVEKDLSTVEEGRGHNLLSSKEGKKYIQITDGAANAIILKSLKKGNLSKSSVEGLFAGSEYAIIDVEALKSKSADILVECLLSDDNEAIHTAKKLKQFHHEDLDDRKEVTIAECITYFEEDNIVLFDYMGRQVAGAISSVSGETTMFGSYLNFKCRIITIASGNSEWREVSFSIPVYKGHKPVSELPAKLATDDEIANLVKRNKALLDKMSETRFLSLTGEMYEQSFFGPSAKYVNGRVVLDPVAFYEMDSSEYKSTAQGLLRSSGGKPVRYRPESFKMEDEEDYAFILPFALGFSLDKKTWGAVALEDLSPIKFRDDAFDTMVMEQSRKDMLLAIANSVGNGFSDIIDNKGGGSTILLHGDPGLGKTLTAEAMAEYLKKPLYKVSIGELGTDVKSLEEQLEKVLQLAESWGAILLIDEADIFMEERTSHDIQRNAMVTVFLRLLEYYSGILFLTTNRVKNIDRAFYSRITMALTFKDGDEDTKRKIWESLLSAAKVEDINVDDLIDYNVNGRQIKNSIIGARGIANFRQENLGTSHIIEMLENNKKFIEELTSF